MKTFETLHSQTRNQRYTPLDLIKKAEIRADVSWDILVEKHTLEGDLPWESITYGDYDATLHLQVKIGESLWTESLSGTIEAVLPVHVSYRGVFEWGYHQRINGVSLPWQEHVVDDFKIIFTGYTGSTENTENIVINYFDLEEELKNEVAVLIKDFIVRDSLLGQNLQLEEKKWTLA